MIRFCSRWRNPQRGSRALWQFSFRDLQKIGKDSLFNLSGDYHRLRAFFRIILMEMRLEGSRRYGISQGEFFKSRFACFPKRANFSPYRRRETIVCAFSAESFIVVIAKPLIQFGVLLFLRMCDDARYLRGLPLATARCGNAFFI